MFSSCLHCFSNFKRVLSVLLTNPCVPTQALYDFEEVIAMERKPPVTARDYITVSSLYRVAHYNVACCYSAIDQVCCPKLNLTGSRQFMQIGGKVGGGCAVVVGGGGG